jgi:hypothetical protein
MHKSPMAPATLRCIPQPCSGVEHRLVRERSIAPLRPAAWALDRLLRTVAEAQGLRDSAAPSLGHRVALTASALHQARPGLSTPGFIT